MLHQEFWFEQHQRCHPALEYNGGQAGRSKFPAQPRTFLAVPRMFLAVPSPESDVDIPLAWLAWICPSVPPWHHQLQHRLPTLADGMSPHTTHSLHADPTVRASVMLASAPQAVASLRPQDIPFCRTLNSTPASTFTVHMAWMIPASAGWRQQQCLSRGAAMHSASHQRQSGHGKH